MSAARTLPMRNVPIRTIDSLHTIQNHPALGPREGSMLVSDFLSKDGYVLRLDADTQTVSVSHKDNPHNGYDIPWNQCRRLVYRTSIDRPVEPPSAAVALPVAPEPKGPVLNVVDPTAVKRVDRERPNAIPAALQPPMGATGEQTYISREVAATMSEAQLEAAEGDGAIIEGVNDEDAVREAEPKPAAKKGKKR